MTLNEHVVKGKWKEIKGEVQKAWGRLTDDELEKTRGDVKSIEGLLEQKYGKQQEGYSDKLTDIMKRFSDTKDGFVDKVKSSLKEGDSNGNSKQ